MASQLTLSEERERRRIARELHDEVGQTLAFARTGLASARKTTSEARREAVLDDVSQSLRQAIRDTRDLVFDLSSPLMNELGLGAALREWLEDQVGKKARPPDRISSTMASAFRWTTTCGPSCFVVRASC